MPALGSLTPSPLLPNWQQILLSHSPFSIFTATFTKEPSSCFSWASRTDPNSPKQETNEQSETTWAPYFLPSQVTLHKVIKPLTTAFLRGRHVGNGSLSALCLVPISCNTPRPGIHR